MPKAFLRRKKLLSEAKPIETIRDNTTVATGPLGFRVKQEFSHHNILFFVFRKERGCIGKIKFAASLLRA